MKKSRGFAIATALFLVVILAMLGAFMVSMSNTEHSTSAQDVRGSQAYRAARMGMEWAVAKICNGAGCATPLTACPAASTTMSAAPNGFTVTVDCTMNSYNEAGTTRYIFWVTSTATSSGSAGGLGFLERQFSAFIEFPA